MRASYWLTISSKSADQLVMCLLDFPSCWWLYLMFRYNVMLDKILTSKRDNYILCVKQSYVKKVQWSKEEKIESDGKQLFFVHLPWSKLFFPRIWGWEIQSCHTFFLILQIRTAAGTSYLLSHFVWLMFTIYCLGHFLAYTFFAA